MAENTEKGDIVEGSARVLPDDARTDFTIHRTPGKAPQPQTPTFEKQSGGLTPEKQKRFDAMDMEEGVAHLENNPSRQQANIDTTFALKKAHDAYRKAEKVVSKGENFAQRILRRIGF